MPTLFPMCVTPENLVKLAQPHLLICKLKIRIIYMLQDCGDKIYIYLPPVNLA